MFLHYPNTSILIKLFSAKDSHEYATTKNNVQKNYPKLVDYLNKGNRWQKISRFENSPPRDMNLATSCVESFNAFISRNDLKNQEPIVIFKEIYSSQKIFMQKTYLTNFANKSMSFALRVATCLQIKQTNFNYGFYEIGKPNEEPTCTVTLLPEQQPECTCNFYADCGMPCVHILAFACHYKLDWCQCVHQRLFPVKYRALFGEHYHYIDFNQMVPYNGKPLVALSLKQRQKRYKDPAEFK